MSLRAEFNQAAIDVFDCFGDLIENVTYAGPGTFNPVTETYSGGSSETVRLSRREFTRKETDGMNVMMGDLEVMIITSELTATPTVDDTITMDSVDYLVRAVGNIQGVLWRLQLRRV